MLIHFNFVIYISKKMRHKQCHRCEKAANTMYRVRYKADKAWYFLCKECVEIEKKENPLYQYGGTWKK